VSIDIMNRIWWRDDLPTMEKFVALALADAASDDGVCWPAIDTVADKCSCSRRTVQNAISGLCAKQLLRRRERKDRSSFYIFNLDHLPQMERPRRLKELSPADDAGIRGAAPAPDLFCTGAGDSGTGAGDSGRGAAPAPRTIKEPSVEPSLEDSGDFAEIARPLLHEYVEDRWHAMKRLHPGIADVRKIDDGMRHTIEVRAKQHAKAGQDGFAVWNEFFETAMANSFLMGRAPPGRGRDKPFTLSLPWALKANNFREIIGGRYVADGNSSTFDTATGRRFGPAEQAVRGSVERLRASREQCRGSGDPRGHLALPAS
jgi:hypothetical protein